jgi:hypothetical protein
VWQVLEDLDARSAAVTIALGPGPVDDGLLHALLSFTALTSRAPVMAFLRERAQQTDPGEGARLAGLLVGLFGQSGDGRPSGQYAAYWPRPVQVTGRVAAYRANLVLLAACFGGSVLASNLFPGAREPVREWHHLTELWHSELHSSEGWSTMSDALAVDRLRAEGRRDLRIRLATDKDAALAPVDLGWTHRWSGWDDRAANAAITAAGDSVRGYLRRSRLVCGVFDDVVAHTLEPLTAALPGGFAASLVRDDRPPALLPHLLLQALLLPVTSPDDTIRRQAYEDVARLVGDITQPLDVATRTGCLTLLLDRLATDQIPPDLMAFLLTRLATVLGTATPAEALVIPLVRCAVSVLGVDEGSDGTILSAVSLLLRRVEAPREILVTSPTLAFTLDVLAHRNPRILDWAHGHGLASC